MVHLPVQYFFIVGIMRSTGKRSNMSSTKILLSGNLYKKHKKSTPLDNVEGRLIILLVNIYFAKDYLLSRVQILTPFQDRSSNMQPIP